MIVPRLAARSLANRKLSAGLTVASIALSVLLLLGVATIRDAMRTSFADTVSGTDLLVGARTGAVELLLYSVFHIGNATNNIRQTSVDDIARRPEVEWIVPISLGDSHRGFRVVGTSAVFFDRYRYRDRQPIAFRSGKPFADLFDTVIGADVADALGYRVGDQVVVAHGLGTLAGMTHQDAPFVISGVIAKTGTPVDKSVFISMPAIEAIHVDWQNGAPPAPGRATPADLIRAMNLETKQLTAVMVGVKPNANPGALRQYVVTYRDEPLTAVLPADALDRLWSVFAPAETALVAISLAVMLAAVVGMMTTILSTLGERRREMAILRAVGARPTTVFALLLAEAGALAIAGALAGIALTYAALFVARPWIDGKFGLYLPLAAPGPPEALALAIAVLAGLAVGLVPAARAYRNSVADGIIVRS
ncbi:MAG: ABC transporter permease [Bauldia sp.]